MPCQVNSILKLAAQNYPNPLQLHQIHEVVKSGYRILPIDVPIALVDHNWLARADVVIRRLVWENEETSLVFEIQRIYSQPFPMKE